MSCARARLLLLTRGLYPVVLGSACLRVGGMPVVVGSVLLVRPRFVELRLLYETRLTRAYDPAVSARGHCQGQLFVCIFHVFVYCITPTQ